MGDEDSHEISPLLVNFGKVRVTFSEDGTLERKTSVKKENKPYTGKHAERFYIKDKEKFESLLQLYNEQQQRKRNDASPNKNQDVSKNSADVTDQRLTDRLMLGPLVSVGKVRVSMQMCSRCGDAGKSASSYDHYFVYQDEVAKTRTILCKGCVGAKLRKLS